MISQTYTIEVIKAVVQRLPKGMGLNGFRCLAHMQRVKLVPAVILNILSNG